MTGSPDVPFIIDEECCDQRSEVGLAQRNAKLARVPQGQMSAKLEPG
jgi:hypothetical protein